MKAVTWRGNTRHLWALQYGSFLTVQKQFKTQTRPPAGRHVKRFLSSEVMIGQVLQWWMVQWRCHLVWRSGLAMWHSAVGSRNHPPHPPPSSCTGAICWESVYSVQVAQRRRVYGCVSRLFLSWICLSSLQVHLYVDCTCVSVTYVSVQRARTNAFMCVHAVIFLCVTLCVDAVKVDAISVNCTRNRIVRSLIDSHFS